MTEMLRLLDEPKQLNAAVDFAKTNASHFEELERWNEMSKWIWFLKKLEEEQRIRGTWIIKKEAL